MEEEKRKNPFLNDKFAKISQNAVELLGLQERMLYLSKSMKKPTTIFNANIYNSKADKIWYGDLEIEKDREALIELSNREGTLYILWEMDGRFLQEPPTIACIRYKAIVTIENRIVITYSHEFQKYVDFVTRSQIQKNKPVKNRPGCKKRRRS
jgi:hypothetical protein